ncbi:MAG: glycosyltransferase family 39 protein [Candidatus Omnitrophota bacterium]|jgi:hypothetical protein
MNFLALIPFIISAISGFCLLSLILPCRQPKDLPCHAALSAGLGLGVSSILAWTNFLLLQQFHKTYLMSCHVILLLTLLYFYNKKSRPLPGLDRKTALDTALAALLLSVLLAVAWHFGKFYPFGGWDAWQVWNIKAKFLFLGEDHWRNMLQPSLWQTSPHYPLLLPLINVWGWTLQGSASPETPFLTAMIFTGLTAFLLWAILYSRDAQRVIPLLPALILLTHPFFITLGTSQYADILFAFYLLASLFCLLKSLDHEHAGYGILASLFLGLLAFSKPEGTLLALQAFASTVIMRMILPKAGGQNTAQNTPPWGLWAGSFFLAMIPTIIFNVFYSPGNQTFINGLSSADHPVSLYRIKMILAFLTVELKSPKWNGIWVFILAGLILQVKQCFQKERLLIPGILLIYLASVLSYYFLNTYFKIDWWLQVSLHRILFTLLPACLLWIFWPLCCSRLRK